LYKCRTAVIVGSMKNVLALAFMLTAVFGVRAEGLPDWMLPLREAVYEQVLSADEVRPLYLDALSAAEQNASGASLNLAVSQAEYFMGRALLFEERNPEARTHFSEGLRLAQLTVQQAPSAQAWALRGDNLAHLIQASNWTFAMANGLDVEKFANSALAIDGRNAAAKYLIASRWVFAPSPFNNINRGIDMMQAILRENNMEKDDLFNVNSAIGWGYLQQRKYEEAKPYIRRAIEVYPTNVWAAELLQAAESGRKPRL